MVEGRILGSKAVCARLTCGRPCPAGATAGARGRLLDDSALGWPGAGASPARLVGSDGPQRRFSAIEERRGGSSAQSRAGAGGRDTYRYGPWREAAGRAGDRRAGVGRRSALRLRLKPGGRGPPAGSAAPGARDPASGPSAIGNPPGSPGCASLRRRAACRPHGDPCVRVPAGCAAVGSGCLSLPGPRRPCAGESEPPPDPAPFPGSRQPATLGLGRCQSASPPTPTPGLNGGPQCASSPT